MMKKEIKTKTNDFKELIETNCLYIDKTLFIKEISDNICTPCLLLRPKGFGKTLNMSMIKYYFDITLNSKHLFYNLKIWECGSKYLNEMNKYPVISLSFKELKANNYHEFIKKYKILMKKLYKEYEFLLKSPEFDDIDKKDFKEIINCENYILDNPIEDLIRFLNNHYKRNVIVILEDYDVPLLEGYSNGYGKEIESFLEQFINCSFKDNSEIQKLIMTGVVTSFAVETNNINVYDTTYATYQDYFGFTENEVKEVLKEYDLENTFDKVKEWYDGYLFNKTTIYNPISILKYLKNEAHAFLTYLSNMGGVDLLKNLIYNLNNKQEILNSYEKLLKTGIIEHINLNINLDLSNLEGNKDNIFTLFMFCGYLTPNGFVENYEDVNLKIPNLEIRKNLENIVRNWFNKEPLKSFEFTEYLYNDQLELFKENFENVVVDSFSYYDVPDNNNGENFYHAFTMGLLMSGSNNYEITSNRESGYGRYDLILKPFEKNKTAYIIEFKVSDLDFDKTINEGFKQIDDRRYDVSLKDYKIVKMIIAFKGKKLKIETR